MSEKKDIKYTDAVQELETIINELEQNETDVDNLSKKVKRAAFLIALCRKKLNETEEDVKGILDELKGSD